MADALLLLRLMETYQPKDATDLLARIPHWREVLQQEITSASAPKPFFAARLEVPWELFDCFLYHLDQKSGESTAESDAVTRPTKPYVSVDRGYGYDSRFNRELDRLLPQLNETVRSFRALADLLARHPEALVKGRPAPGKE